MKFHTMQSKFLVISIIAILVIAVCIGALSIVEVDRFVQSSTESLVSSTCEEEASRINLTFRSMEKSVKIVESYLLFSIDEESPITDPNVQREIIQDTEKIFADVASHTDGTVAYYLRLDPSISDSHTGFFYSKKNREGDFLSLPVTDLALYARNDTEHVGWYWEPYYAGKPIWMMPYYNDNNDVMMISHVIPLYVENQFIGVVGMDFDYAVLTDTVDSISIYQNGFAHLEFNNKIAYHKDLTPGDPSPANSEYLRATSPLANGMKLVLSASRDDMRKIRRDIEWKIVWLVLFLAVFFSILLFFLVRKLVRPIKNLTKAAKKLSDGNYDVEIVHSDVYEIELLNRSFESMALHLREHNQIQELLAYRDSLTGLRNTTSYNSWVSDFDKELDRRRSPFGVVILDINHLKKTNDQYGHDVGNKVIVTASGIISDVFKRSPVFRIGGDEFLVILQNRDLENYEILLKQLEDRCSQHFVESGSDKIFVSIAKGFSRYLPDTDKAFADVFNRADAAMYENKREMKGEK